jgi:hypothetical protein
VRNINLDPVHSEHARQFVDGWDFVMHLDAQLASDAL